MGIDVSFRFFIFTPAIGGCVTAGGYRKEIVKKFLVYEPFGLLKL